MSLLTASMYLLCLVALIGSALFVLFRDLHSRLNRLYALLALALLGWVGTLFVYATLPIGETLLLVGRANFAAAALVATAAYLFAMELARGSVRGHPAVWLETLLLAALSLGTPLIDRNERVMSGMHSTVYGPLFALYAAHIVIFLGGAVVAALRPTHGIPGSTRIQLRLVGTGILATALIGVITNIVLPYWFGDFRLIHVGTLSTALFLLAVSYAVFAYHLFSVRVIVRATFVLAGLVALALELYSLALSSLAHLIPFGDPREREFTATALVLVVNAFTQESVRRWLESVLDRVQGGRRVGRKQWGSPRAGRSHRMSI